LKPNSNIGFSIDEKIDELRNHSLNTNPELIKISDGSDGSEISNVAPITKCP